MKKYQIIVYGRGGQGGKTTAELITQAAFAQGKFVQSFPEFGPERGGAPVQAFVRISDQPIKTHQSVFAADGVLILDDTLLEDESLQQELLGKLNEGALVLINSRQPCKKFDAIFQAQKGIRIIVTDASGLAKKVVGENRANVVILGKFAQKSGMIRVEDLIEVFRAKYLSKIGKEKTQKNIDALIIASEKEDEACKL